MPDLGDAIEALRALDEPVPEPLQLPTEAEIADAARRAGVVLHPDLVRYLLEASDVVVGTLEPITIGAGPNGLGAVVEAAKRAGVPDGLVPFCEDNGDFACLATDGHVVYWAHGGASDEIWPSLAHWIVEVWIGGG